MTSKKETFASLMQAMTYRYDLRTAFDDFLTVTLAAFSQNTATGKSYDEMLYMQTIAKYDKQIVREVFPSLLARLTIEMEERHDSDSGNDVLGEFYEENIYRKGAAQYFTPWLVCEMMAKCLVSEHEPIDRPLRILDPSCGSGRMLLAGARSFGKGNEWYGIDIDQTCVKMAAINLFLNGMFHSEVMCADALFPEQFQASYIISFLPFGVFRIADKDNSRLWRMYAHSLERKQSNPKQELKFIESSDAATGKGTQLELF